MLLFVLFLLYCVFHCFSCCGCGSGGGFVLAVFDCFVFVQMILIALLNRATGPPLSDPKRIRFCTSGPVPISMCYSGSSWTERSQIRPASGETDRDHIRHFYSGPAGHRSIRIESGFVQLARF